MTARVWLRASLVVLTVLHAGAGGWQLLWPRSFYDDFPLPGHPWVAMLLLAAQPGNTAPSE